MKCGWCILCIIGSAILFFFLGPFMETREVGFKNPTSVGLGEDFCLKNIFKGCFYHIFLGRLQAGNDGLAHCVPGLVQ